MKEKLEAVLAGLKIFGVLLAIFFAFLLIYHPQRVASQIKTIGNELRDLEDSVEYSLFFVKVTTSGTTKGELESAQNNLAVKNNALLCSVNPAASCSDQDKKEAKNVLEKLKLESTITVGQNGSITLPEAWIVLASSFGELPSAVAASQTLSNQNFEYEIISAANRYRLAAVYKSQNEAQNAVKSVNAAISRTDSYVRFLTVWCDDHKRTSESVDGKDVDILSCDRSKQLAAKK